MEIKDYKIFNKNSDKIKDLESQKIDILKLKEKLKKQGLTHKQRQVKIAKALDKNFLIDIAILKLTEFTQSEKLAKIQPYYATKKTTSQKVDNSMRLKKLKGINFNIRGFGSI